MKRAVGPLLDDLVETKARYKEVLNDATRWQSPVKAKMKDLHHGLLNTNLALVLPGLAEANSVKWKWAAAQASKLKKMLDQKQWTGLWGKLS